MLENVRDDGPILRYEPRAWVEDPHLRGRRKRAEEAKQPDGEILISRTDEDRSQGQSKHAERASNRPGRFLPTLLSSVGRAPGGGG